VPPRPPARPRQRRALSAASGPVSTAGDPALARLAGEALAVPPEAESRLLTHGFHSYPARFHPLLARKLLADLPRGATVLDPFVGSGTTLVEALVVGARALGSDVNPLAVELTRLKASVWPEPRRALLVERARVAAERSLARVKQRARTRGSGERYDDPTRYAPHVFRELVGLREELGAEPDHALRRALLLVLSAIVIKVSRQPSETAAGSVERAIGKGLPTRIFQRKAEELAKNLAELAAVVPAGTPPVEARLADARRLEHVRDASVDRVITSPPYLGTYDYAEQHARRFGWLGLERAPVDELEIGARRGARDARAALAEWQADVDAFVAEIARVLKPGALACVIVGDSALGREVIAGDQALRHAAARSRLRVVASAAQLRPNFYEEARRSTRREHLLMIQR